MTWAHPNQGRDQSGSYFAFHHRREMEKRRFDPPAERLSILTMILRLASALECRVRDLVGVFDTA